jgi:DUF4097 and DUF4098 domain-containing protein YvlB
MTNWEFPCAEPATVDVSSWPSGSVAISGQPTDVIAVEVQPGHRGGEELLDQVRVNFSDGRLVITGPKGNIYRRRASLDLTIQVPGGSSCDVTTASADISCVGDLEALGLSTASGDVTVASASGPVSVKTASGDVFIDRVGDEVRIDSTSGDTQIGEVAGNVDIKSTSGDVTVGRCGGSSVFAHAISGDIQFKEISAGRAEIEAMSGDITVAVAPGIGVYLDLSAMSGDVRSDLDEDGDDDSGSSQQPDLQLRCRTISGDIRVRKARASA